MLSNFINSLVFYFNNLEPIDIITLIWFVIVVFLFLILGILLFAKHSFLGGMIVFFMFLTLISGPFFIKWYLNNSMRNNEFNITQTKQLNYTDTFFIVGHIKNNSQNIFTKCRVFIDFKKQSKNDIKKIFNDLKPLKTHIQTFNEIIKPNEVFDFKITLENFKIAKDVNLTGYSECYK